MRKVDYEEAATMYRSGSTHSEIAKHFGVHRTAISSGFLAKGVTTRRAQKIRLSPEDMTLAYVAGVFDGEGHVSVVLSKSQRIDQFWLQVGITNTDKDLIDFLRQSFGVGYISLTSGSGKEGKLLCWSWRCTTADALHVLELLHPYLRVKKRVVELAIEFQRNAKEHGLNEWRAEMKSRISELNRAT